MFLDTLSTTVLQLCNARNWNYEVAAEHCNLSPRYFGDIARRQTAPSINTLEKLCSGFQLLPNDLLVAPLMLRKPMYKDSSNIKQCRDFNDSFCFTACPICSQYRQAFERFCRKDCPNSEAALRES